MGVENIANSADVKPSSEDFSNNQPNLENPNIATDQDPSLQSETVEVSRVLEQVEQHLDQQPESVKAFLEQFRGEFQTGCRVDGKNFIFTGLFDTVVVALVNDDDHPEIYNLRFFHCSGSDHQFKAYPGNDEQGRHLKGDEADCHHHYVQSGKLDARVTQEIQNAVAKSGLDEEKRPETAVRYFIPRVDNKKSYYHRLGFSEEKFNFSEKQVELKNEQWQNIFADQEKFYQLYLWLSGTVGASTLELAGEFGEYSGRGTRNMEILEVDALKEYVHKTITYSSKLADKDNLLPFFQRIDEIINNHGSYWLMAGKISEQEDEEQYWSSAEMMNKDAKAILEEIYNITDYFIESPQQLEQMQASDFIPDFSKEPIRQYEKTMPAGLGNAESKIHIEEFDVQSPEGDHLRWAMARDDDGNVYVDNIYDPEVGIDDYGVPKLKLNAGLLVYKPTDYEQQTRHLRPKYVEKRVFRTYKKYLNINKYFQQQLPVKLYRESLINRGELQEENKTSSFPVGSELKVIKIDDANGEIKIGKEYSGTLKQPIEVGSIVDVSSITTSRVVLLIPGNGKLVVETSGGSRYEISLAEEKSVA